MNDYKWYDKLVEAGGKNFWREHKHYWIGIKKEDIDLIDYLVYKAFVGGKELGKNE
jgi:hypothetical protein